MSKHTPEPWFGCCNQENNPDKKPHFIFSTDARKAICSIFYNDPTIEGYEDMEDIITLEEAKANSRRIAACVNACAGMEDPIKEITELKLIKEQYLSMQNQKSN